MKTNLSESGPSLSRIVAGCMSWGEWGAKLKEPSVLKLIEGCLEIGITTFDHADIYGHYTTEAQFGTALKGKSSLREKIQLVTKCGIQVITANRPENKIPHYQLDKDYIIGAAEKSLKNLFTEYIDLLLIHRPSPLMHPSEIAEAFENLQTAGKVRHFGVSNFTPSQFDLLNNNISLVTNQVEFSVHTLHTLTDGTLDQCLEHRIKPMAYSVMAAGAFFENNPSERIQGILKIAQILATKYDASLDQIIIAWVLKHPSGILPVMGSTKINRLKDAVGALGHCNE